MTNHETPITPLNAPNELGRRDTLRYLAGGAALIVAALATEGCTGQERPDSQRGTATPEPTPTPEPSHTTQAESTPQSPERGFASEPSWEQDFSSMRDGTPLDENFWNIQEGTTIPGYTGEAEILTNHPKNLGVKNGALDIEAHKENYGGREYTSARIDTQGKREFRYGKIEVTARMPEGVGTWPALWLFNTKNEDPDDQSLTGSEIDFAETVGSERGRIFPAVHTPATHAEGEDNLGPVEIPGMYDGFQTYGVELSPGKIVFTLNGKPYKTAKKPHNASKQEWPFDSSEYYLIMDLAMGGPWAGAEKSAEHPDGIVGNGPWRMSVQSAKFYEYTGKTA